MAQPHEQQPDLAALFADLYEHPGAKPANRRRKDAVIAYTVDYCGKEQGSTCLDREGRPSHDNHRACGR